MPLHLDLADMRLFVNIAESNSFTRGAERSGISLPAASLRVKNIEDDIGVKLLYRASTGVTLTPPGDALLHHARIMLQQMERLKGDLQAYAEGVKGHLRIAANTTAITEMLPTALSRFLATHPDVDIELRERLSGDIVRAVSDGMTDIGIVAGNVLTEGLDVLPYRQDRLVIAVGNAHPLAQHGAVDYRDTLDYDFVGLHEDSAIHAFSVQAARVLNRPLRMRVHVGNFEALCRMIEMGVGIGILPELPARRYEKQMGIRILALNDEWAARNLKICTRSLEALPGFARALILQLTNEAR
ncbi:LysR substrate-binding domain-containing protein [Paraburkholderia sp. J41]|uniref:LysR family transcriptional regulator n=1 Tax=Paraburkholderia sp. J41 TaxID=2805433 RepID=UPI002AC35384|nr:LysR substrate-binding domain-containing protein [Paraburkholderia sp. J41]